MAGYPLNIEPLPTVNPIGAPGDDFEHIQASPDMFGGTIARALGTLGQGLEKASGEGFQVAQQRQEIQDKTRAAELHSYASDQWSKNSGDYLQLEGRAALSALPAYKQKNKEIFDSIVSQADDPYTKLLIQSQSRRIMDSHNEMAERHAAGQEKIYQRKTAELNEASSGNQAVLFATNGDIPRAKQFLFDAGQEARNQAELQGYEGKALDQVVAQRRGQFVYNIVEGLVRKEGPGYGPKAALEFYQSERNQIDAGSATRIEGFLDNQLTTIIGQKRGDELWNKADHSPAVSGRREVVDSTVSAWRKAGMSDNGIAGILHNIKEESGFNPGLRHPDQPNWGGEAHFAHGLYQEGGAEWNRYAQWLQQQHPGADWRNHALQSEFAAWNLKSNYSDVWQRMNAARTPEAAAAIYARDYLKPAAVFLHSRLNAISRGIAPIESYGAAPGSQQAQSASATTPAPLTPASFETPQQGAPIAFPVPPTGVMQPAIVPWQAKKAAALQEALDDPDLRDRPKQLAAVIGQINKRAETEHAQAIDDSAAEKAQEKAAKLASDAAEIAVMQDTASDHPKISAQQMLADPKLSREAKERLMKYFPAVENREKDRTTYGPGFFDAYKAVHAPIGDPGRITDPTQLYNMVGPHGSLTVAGVDKLITEMFKPKTPETEAESKMKQQFLENAKRQVSGEHGFAKLKDPKGDEIFLKFLGYFYPAYEKARKDGKTPGELLDPTSKDYLGKPLETMKRPMNVWYQDVINDNPETVTGKPPPAKFDPATVKGVTDLQNAYLAGQIDRATASQIAIERGWAARRAPPPSPIEQPPQIPLSR